MRKTTRPKPAAKGIPHLYIGEWIAAVQMSQAEVARRAGMSAPYLNELISGTKLDPRTSVAHAIATAIGIQVGDLFNPPPSADVLRAIRRLHPSTAAKFLPSDDE